MLIGFLVSFVIQSLYSTSLVFNEQQRWWYAVWVRTFWAWRPYAAAIACPERQSARPVKRTSGRGSTWRRGTVIVRIQKWYHHLNSQMYCRQHHCWCVVADNILHGSVDITLHKNKKYRQRQLTSARARAMRLFWPPLSLDPFSPICAWRNEIKRKVSIF